MKKGKSEKSKVEGGNTDRNPDRKHREQKDGRWKPEVGRRAEGLNKNGKMHGAGERQI